MTAPARPQLTPGQLAALKLVAEGLTLDQTGARLGITHYAVKLRLHRAMARLGARNSTHAVFLACRAGILDGRPQRHGDHAGYAAHKYRGEEPKDCPHGCWEGEQAYRAAQRRAKRARERATGALSRPNGAPGQSGPSGLETACEAPRHAN